MKLGSLFDGIGGFPLVGSWLGFEPVWASEIEEKPISITKRQFPSMKHLGDITKINGADIEPVDVITFGSPCQDLSVAGKRAGLEGSRSNLFLDAVRIIYEMREKTNEKYPTFAVWENVPGAFSSNGGLDFRAVLEEIGQAEIPMPKHLGKWSNAGMVRTQSCGIAWRTLDAKYWGVPQRRKRIFLVADFREEPRPEILFEPEGVSRYSAKGICPWQGAARSAESCIRAAGFSGNAGAGSDIGYIEEKTPTHRASILVHALCIENHPIDGRCKISEDGMVQTLTSRMGTGGMNVPLLMDKASCGGYSNYKESAKAATQRACIAKQTDVDLVLEQPRCICIQGNCIDRADTAGCNGKGWTEDVSYTLNTVDRPAVCYENSGFGKYTEGIGTLRASGGDLGGGSENIIFSRQRSDQFTKNDIVSTQSARQYKDATDLVVNFAVRRLTPLECERLQGFPDYWTLHGADGEEISDTQRYKALGNSVALPCVEFVLQKLIETVEVGK